MVTPASGSSSDSGARSRSSDLSLQEAADLLGVHYMTAYRYVRTGRLDATQVDGTWHVARSSIDKLRAPATAGRAKRGAAAHRGRYALRLSERLLQGDEAEAWRVTEQALASGCTVEDLYLEVLGPALARVGDEWAAGRVSVAEEHRSSALMYRLVGRLGPLCIRRGRSRGVVVLGALANDQHGLASALVGDVLRNRGYAVADLGGNTPAASFVDAIRNTDRVVAVGIVVSTRQPDAVIARTVAAVRAATDAPVLLGGVGIRDDRHAHRLGADAGTGSAREAVDAIDALVRS